MTNEPPPPAITLDHPALGRVEFEPFTFTVRPYWEHCRVEVLPDEGSVRVSICFFEGRPTMEVLDIIARALGDLPRYAREARQAILGEGKARELALGFKEHVFEFETDILLKCLGVRRSADIDIVRFIESLKLVDLHVHGDLRGSEHPRTSFNYSIDRDISA